MTIPKNNEELSTGAKTFITEKAKEYVYNYKKGFTSKYTDKGIIVEDESIELLNQIMTERGEFIEYKKNDIRYTNDHLTGEPDIIDALYKRTRDIKSSWNIDTFPATIESAMNKSNAKVYEWQGRGYMLLCNENGIEINQHIVDYCLINTPEQLLNINDLPEHHNFDDYPIEMRVTSIVYERDLELEKLIIDRVIKAQEYFIDQVGLIRSEKGANNG